MKRVIKFRAWDKKKSEMIYDGIEFSLRVIEYPGIEGVDKTSIGFSDINPDCFEIQQFTGLHDKNGKEIYEGDILNNTEHGHIFKITWGIENETYAGWAGVWINSENGFISPLYNSPLVNCEIIGNIYENPELLKP